MPHRLIDSDEVDGEVEHLREVFEWAKIRLLAIEDSTEERLGAVEARIFEPQLLMLEDPELIDGAELVGGFPLDQVTVGHTSTVGVAPTVGNLRVCQYPLAMEVTSPDGGVCAVTGSGTGPNAWLSVSVEGLSPGSCSFTVSFPPGGEDATGTFSVDVAE